MCQLSSVRNVSAGEFERPGRGKGIIDVFRHRYLLTLLIRKGTATRYRNSVLGWVWSYVKPAAQFTIYYFVVGQILGLHRGVENFPIYLFSGIVVVNLFNEAFGNATSSIVDNRALVRKIYMPRELFPVAAIVIAFVHFLPQLAILLVVCLLVGWVPSVLSLLGFVCALVLVVLFALGLGLLFSGLNVRYRDAQNFVELIRMFSTWTSPVLYTWILLKETIGTNEIAFAIYNSNPLTVAVHLSHHAFWDKTVAVGNGLPPGFALYGTIAAIATLLLLMIGQFTFRRFERSFAQDL
ncbi:sugar ABC transporter permease [Microbacterium aurantiacum]|uniref:Transport permease protein n=1 Tax=Microbacterium aurantiacum TaxID=162393 RepID=A0A0M9VLH0_9MICO|nr:sugar ABC transporter permease [Microbacterium chocolatum]KOS11142.1 sugar ABC transporter permease [Microbacterium chocolatum]